MASGLEKLDSQRTARIDSGQGRRSAQPERRGHHDDLRGARRPDLDRHPRRRRERARSGHRTDPPAALCATAARRRGQRGERHRDRRGHARAISGSAPMAAASIWRAPDGTVVKVFRHDPATPPACPRIPCTRSRSTRRAGSGSGPTAAASPVVGSRRVSGLDPLRGGVARGGTVERHHLRGARATPRDASGSAATPA